MLEALFFLWELPQNILGLLLWTYARRQVTHIHRAQGRVFLHAPFGVSLGRYVFWCGTGDAGERIRYHEYGHTFQSRLLGPLYLLLVGVPSLSRNVYSRLHYQLKGAYWPHYYQGYPERWADELAARHAADEI